MLSIFCGFHKLGVELSFNNDDRRALVLRAVVEAYIGSADPVGSAHIASLPEISVSSATIRNAMNSLEQDGYLVQPHTSAGRIPTEKGYRRYVDGLMTSPELGPERNDTVDSFFSGAHFEIEDLLSSTTNLLTNLTNCAAVVTGPSPQRTQIIAVQLISLNSRSVIVVVVDVNGSVEKRTIEWPVDTNDSVLRKLSTLLSDHFRSKEAREIGVAPESDDLSLKTLLELSFNAAKEAIRDAENDGVFIGGASKVAQSFDAVETVRGIISILERHFMVLGLMRSVLASGHGVAIGSEHGLSSLRECAIVVAPYSVDGVQMGTVGLIGPTRMNYGSVIGAAKLVSQNLGRRLSEG